MASPDELTDAITQIESRLKARGLPDLPEDTIQTLVEVITQHDLAGPGKLDYDYIAEQVIQALDASAEGGIVNDRSGQANAAMRAQHGLLAPPGQPRMPRGRPMLGLTAPANAQERR